MCVCVCVCVCVQCVCALTRARACVYACAYGLIYGRFDMRKGLHNKNISFDCKLLLAKRLLFVSHVSATIDSRQIDISKPHIKLHIRKASSGLRVLPYPEMVTPE